MKILLDSRDLIDLLERDQPCTAEHFDTVLRSHDSCVVLCPSHLQELAAPLELGGRGPSSVMAMLNKLERLPLSYANEAKIPRLELQKAINAYRGEGEVPRVDPYVSRMDAAVPLEGPSPTRNFLNYPLSEIVFDLWHNRPDVLRRGSEFGSKLRLAMAARRSRGKGGGDSTEFAVCLPELAALNGLALEGLNIKEFALWLWDNADRCPGIFLWFKVRHELMRNTTDKIQDSDVADLSWTWLLPYVEVATLDRRMRSYVERATRRDTDTMCADILASLEEILGSLGTEGAAGGSPNTSLERAAQAPPLSS